MFDDKPDKTVLRVLLDSDSLKSESAKKLLSYCDNQLLDFVSLGHSTTHTVASVSFGEEDDLGSGGEITIDKSERLLNSGYKSRTRFGYRRADIENISKSIDIKYGDLILVFILKTLTQPWNDRKTILVTERKKLLNRQNWSKRGFPRLPAHSIFSPEEGSFFIDLHFKKSKKFLIGPNFYGNRGLWYLYSMKTKLVSYQSAWSILVFGNEIVPDREGFTEIMSSLGDRITDMLIAIDEIGTYYYADINNDTQDAIIYHFNYWVTLFTGVLDSLAWISKYRYQIPFDKVERIGLRTSRQEGFTELLFSTNSRIRDFLNKNSSVINLMYHPRDLVAHRARLGGIRVENAQDGIDLNMVRIPESFFKQIMEISREKGETLGNWGQYDLGNLLLLEPYRFVKKATSVLIDFVNEYLELLDFNEYERTNPELKSRIEDSARSKDHESFLRDLELFGKYRLGY